MSTLISSRPRHLLAMLAIASGILAACLVIATLALLAVDGHPEGLVAAAVCATVPVMLWGARRLLEFARPAGAPGPSDRAMLTIALEPTSARPTTSEIRGPRILAPS